MGSGQSSQSSRQRKSGEGPIAKLLANDNRESVLLLKVTQVARTSGLYSSVDKRARLVHTSTS